MLASNDRTASLGINEQTFYVTNVAPQWQNSFNGGVWSSLEEDCWENICADTLYVVSGVYFANDNTTVTDQSGKTCVVPTNFYRVLMRSKAGDTGNPFGNSLPIRSSASASGSRTALIRAASLRRI